ncbi:MAG: hypothetical protein WCS94_14045 [Verrucomicrobiota bacterium]
MNQDTEMRKSKESWQSSVINGGSGVAALSTAKQSRKQKSNT